MDSTIVIAGCYALQLAVLIFFFVRLDFRVTNVFGKINLIISQNIKIMNLQDQLNQIAQGIADDLTGIGTDVTGIGASVGTISTGLAALVAAAANNGGQVDLTALQAIQKQADATKSSLDQTVTTLGTVAASVTAALAPAQAPAQNPDPAPDQTGAGVTAAAGTN